MTVDTPLISIQGVSKRFGDLDALVDVSFDVAVGESVALWGSNGAGKTTLIRCLMGVTQFAGDITIAGKSARKNGKDIRNEVGYVPQIMPLFDLPVGEMVLLISKLRRADPAEGVRLLKQFDLGATTQKSVRSLSGGMRQKLALTLALLNDPSILVLDEPTANLDAETQKELLGLLNSLRQDGRTVIFTSHRWSEVRSLADSVVHLERGKVIERGPVSSLAPAHDQVSIRLEFSNGYVDEAVRSLVALGMMPYRNGHHVVVSVPDHQKMDIFTALGENGLVPANFDMEVEE